MDEDGTGGDVGWESAERRFFRRLFWGYVWGIRHIRMIPQMELPLCSFIVLSAKGTYWLVSLRRPLVVTFSLYQRNWLLLDVDAQTLQAR